METKERIIFEAGRKFGVRQAARYLVEMPDQPTLAEELEKWVLPSRQWRRRFVKAFLGKYGFDLPQRRG